MIQSNLLAFRCPVAPVNLSLKETVIIKTFIFNNMHFHLARESIY